MYEKMWYDLIEFLKQRKEWPAHDVITCMDAIERNYLRAHAEMKEIYESTPSRL